MEPPGYVYSNSLVPERKKLGRVARRGEREKSKLVGKSIFLLKEGVDSENHSEEGHLKKGGSEGEEEKKLGVLVGPKLGESHDLLQNPGKGE